MSAPPAFAVFAPNSAAARCAVVSDAGSTMGTDESAPSPPAERVRVNRSAAVPRVWVTMATSPATGFHAIALRVYALPVMVPTTTAS
ncbi:hypothetical protein Mlaev_01243 [Microbacterium laevaniformans]|uniref:Uncharacterized protein n=1 Tax=Microbacterium laevaniformans TaxID=36807 RepID=A0A150HFV8_9MICO|nr:hypothetical protein Mlaev_01243 [Microbacterium laevaniformans]